MLKILCFIKNKNAMHGGIVSYVNNLKKKLNIKKIKYDIISYEDHKIFWKILLNNKETLNSLLKYDLVHFNNVWSIENYLIAKFLKKIINLI